MSEHTYADIITTDEAAELIGVKPSTLRSWRNGTPEQRRTAPPSFLSLGRTVRYSRTDVLAWLEARKTHTRSGGEAA